MATMTIGMRLDAMIASVDELSSTQLYGIIVSITVGISFLVLNSGKHSSSTRQQIIDNNNTSTAVAKSISKDQTQQQIQLAGPQPKWHILKWLNYVICFLFLYSIYKFCANASTYLNDSTSMLQFLIGWCVFLCYFFGFFGISFIDVNDELNITQQQQQQHHHHQQQHQSSVEQQHQTKAVVSRSTTKDASFKDTLSSPTASQKLKKTVPLHPPACSAPVCSDPSSFTKSAPPKVDIKEMDDMDIVNLVLHNKMKDHELEKRLDPFRAVTIRRKTMEYKLKDIGRVDNVLHNLPSTPSLDYSRVYGANCEIVVGYVPIPVGMVGPLTLNQETVYVPMATTEGCLVASTNRGAKAVSMGTGVEATIVRDGITRAPCVRMSSAKEAAELMVWCLQPQNFMILKKAFESTTSFGKLQSCEPTVAGKNVYLRLVCFAGDAMGMNMVSKGSLAVIEALQIEFPTLKLIALSGNMCTDKKAAATNWINGRGKSVVVESTIPKDIVRTTLKTSVKAIVDTNLQKNLVGSAMAGTVGGFNAHASNIVTAVFLATGQDPAQNVESSNCITLLEETADGDLWISCTMPSIEVGTVGGGTSLPAQSSCLQAIGCKGGGATPGDNAKQLAMVVAAATLCGELSLLAALAANTLVQAHMTHNRKSSSSTTTKK